MVLMRVLRFHYERGFMQQKYNLTLDSAVWYLNISELFLEKKCCIWSHQRSNPKLSQFMNSFIIASDMKKISTEIVLQIIFY